MSSNKVNPTGYVNSDPSAKQGGGATNSPLLASTSGGTGPAGHMAASTHLSVVRTTNKVNIVKLFSVKNILIRDSISLLFEEACQLFCKISNSSPFQENQWRSALKALPSALSPAKEGGSHSPPPQKGGVHLPPMLDVITLNLS